MNPAPIPIFLNPAAGAGRAARLQEKLEDELRRFGVPYALHVTESEIHLRQLTRQSAVDHRFIAGAGGDSTFMIMAEEILRAGAGTALGLIGLGSSNDVPAAFGLDSIETACRALRDRRRRRIDLGMILRDGIYSTYFLGQANLGLGAAVNRYVTALAARRPRLAAHQALAGFFGIREAYKHGRVPIRLRIDSGPSGVIEDFFTVAVFANTPLWATGKRIAPEARPDDGLLDACLIGPCSMRRLARLYALAATGRHVGEPEVRLLRSPEFAVGSESAFDVQADGEIVPGPGGPGKNALIIRALPFALEILVPA